MKHQTYLVKVRADSVMDGYSVPMHPELEMVNVINPNLWKAKNTKTGKEVYVSKVCNKTFCEFEVSTEAAIG